MAVTPAPYPVTFEVDYPAQRRDRVTVAFRIFMAIPILIVLGFLTASGGGDDDARQGGFLLAGGGGLTFIPLVLMLVFRQKYPRWWYDWNLQLSRFSTRVGAYFLLLRDEYPSTDEEQSVHLDFVYPDATQLNRWLPLVKWLLAIPHFLVLIALGIVAIFATIAAWFVILFTGNHPRGLFDFVVGVGRWGLRVQAYAFMLTTDRYPPFALR
jgi:hypothetical protein